MDKTEMDKQLHRIAEMADLVYSKERFWAVERAVLGRPARSEAIQALSEELPTPLPPSYVQFLELHDGCLNFWARYALLSTAGQPRAIVNAEVEDARKEQGADVTDASGAVDEAKLRDFEALTDEAGNQREFYVPRHTVFGTNQSGAFLLFNESRKSSTGEYEVVDYSYSARARARYPDFPAFLTAIEDQLQKRIATKGYSSETLPATAGQKVRPRGGEKTATTKKAAGPKLATAKSRSKKH